jgi:hypothetical protein
MHKELSKDIRKALEVARYAPSSHNTQPWSVKIGKSTVDIGYNPDRQLHVGDPNKYELFISLGCFIESLRIASLDLGLVMSLDFLGTDYNAVVKTYFKKNPNPVKKKELNSELIKIRRSDRRLYEEKDLPKNVLQNLEALGDNVAQVMVISKKEDIGFIADMTYKATLDAMSDKSFRKELAYWVRNNWTKKLDGMPAYTQGMPGVISLIAKPIIERNKKVAISQAKKDSKRINHSSSIALLLSKSRAPQNLIEIGKIYQDFCLTALSNDLKTSAISAAVINDETSKEIIERFNLKSLPLAIIRVGYKHGKVKASPRLSLKTITG